MLVTRRRPALARKFFSSLSLKRCAGARLAHPSTTPFRRVCADSLASLATRTSASPSSHQTHLVCPTVCLVVLTWYKSPKRAKDSGLAFGKRSSCQHASASAASKNTAGDQSPASTRDLGQSQTLPRFPNWPAPRRPYSSVVSSALEGRCRSDMKRTVLERLAWRVRRISRRLSWWPWTLQQKFFRSCRVMTLSISN